MLRRFYRIARAMAFVCVAMTLGVLPTACNTTSGGGGFFGGDEARRWVGVIAVKESPEVLAMVDVSDNNPAVYGMAIRRALEQGLPGFEAATGEYCLVPYDNGQPYDQPECYTIDHTGVWTRWAPAVMVSPGRAMCAYATAGWPGIPGQLRFPEAGGPTVNCYDFGPEATGSFAASRDTAAMVILIEPSQVQ